MRLKAERIREIAYDKVAEIVSPRQELDDMFVEAIKQALNEQREVIADIDKLAEIYVKNDAITIACVCDELLDKSGGLLGEVRERAKQLRE